MKPSKFLEITRLAKTALEEEKNWGEDEIAKSASPLLSKGGYRGIAKAQKRTVDAECAAQAQNESADIDQIAALDSLKSRVQSCRECPLGATRLNCVFGDGNPNADLMFIGEGPGFEEDHKGLPFIGKSGQLLTNVISAMGFTRKTVYIANIVKCHPMKDPSDPEKRGNDRPPTAQETAACKKYLDMQIDIIKPKVIITLGAPSTKTLLPNEKESISAIRGEIREYKGIPLIPTYHPSYLIRNGCSIDKKIPDSPAAKELKKLYWSDMKKALALLNGNI